MKTVPFVCAALLSGVLSSAAQASSPDEVVERVVSLADLNLEEEADAVTLYRRIRSAARYVCGRSTALQISASLNSLDRRCVNEAIARATEYVDAPLLSHHAVQYVAAVRVSSQPVTLARTDAPSARSERK
jgi:UrcA family protein